MIISIFSPRRIFDATVLVISRLFAHRRLLAEQLRRELFEQHVGHVMGGIWLIVHPLFLMSIYVFVFGIVFQSRVGGTREMPFDYTTYILSGLVPWLTIQHALTKSCTALTQNTSLIKQVVFPIEVLPAKAVLSQLVPFTLMISIVIVYVIISSGDLPVSYLLIPVLMILLIPWMLGLGLILSAATVFIRDITEIVRMFTTAGIFILPVIYLPNWVPAIFKPVIYINPISYIIWCFRDVLYFGRIEHPFSWIVLVIGGLIVLSLGCRAFQAVRPYLGDAL